MRRSPDPSRPGENPRGARVQLGILLIMIVGLLGPLTSSDTGPAAATASEEAAFLVELNEVRVELGLPPFTINAELSDLAREHAQVMADSGEIFHASPISAGYEGPWSKIGENVGVGADVSVLVDAFVASPGHYANIVDPAFTEIGIGVVWRENALYTTHRFLEVPGSPTITAPPTPSPTTTAPRVPTTTAPSEPADDGSEPAIEEPGISAERVVELLDLLDQVGT